MTATLVDIHDHRGPFFEVLQETERTQTAVMTITPGEDGGPEETHAGDQVVSQEVNTCACAADDAA